MPDLIAIGNGIKNIPLDALQNWDELGVMPWRTGGAGGSALQLASAVGYLARCIELRASAVAGVPWALYSGTGTQPVWSSSQPTPPDAYSAFVALPELLQRTEAALCLTGQSFIFVERNRVRVTSLRWLDPTSVTPHWTPAGIDYFERRVNNRTERLQPQDVCYVWLRGLSETEPKTPPAQAAAASANVLLNLDQFVATFFQRGAIRATLLTVEGTPLPAERERLKSWWQRFMAGAKNAFAAEVVSAQVKPVVVGEGVSELSNVALTEEKRQDIATALGVPHSLVLSNAANYATAEVDRRHFYEATIVPQCNLLERQLNSELFAPLGLRFAFMPEALDVFQADEGERAGAFAQYVQAGIARSIAAQMLGLELPEGVEYSDLDPQPAPVAPAPPAPAETEAEPAEGKRVEAAQFRRWRKKRPNIDLSDFAAHYLSPAELAALAGETKAAPAGPDAADAARQARMAAEERMARSVEQEMEAWFLRTFHADLTEAEVRVLALNITTPQALRDAIERGAD